MNTKLLTLILVLVLALFVITDIKYVLENQAHFGHMTPLFT